MGTKFNILSDNLITLLEKSEFSKFFTSPEPIKVIHNSLRVSHDTDLRIEPTTNRHKMWDALRAGNGLFVVIDKPGIREYAISELHRQMVSSSPETNRTRSYNELMSNLRRLLDKARSTPISSNHYKDIKKQVYGSTHSKTKSIMKQIDEAFDEGNSFNMLLRDAVKSLLSALMPGEIVLIKRYTDDSYIDLAPRYQPSERKFRVARVKDRRHKVFGQEYTVFIFNNNQLLDVKIHKKNAIGVYEEYFHGRGHRDFYIISNKKFLQTLPDTLSPTPQLPFSYSIVVDDKGVQGFVNKALNKFETAFNNKANTLIQSVQQNIAAGIPGLDMKTITRIQDTVHEIKTSNPIQLFRYFISKCPEIDLDNYDIIHKKVPYISLDPFRVDKWDTETGEPNLKKYDNIDTWKAQSKESGKQAIVNYAKGWCTGSCWDRGSDAAIVFKDETDYNKFMRIFIKFILNTKLTTPEMMELSDILLEI